MWCRHHNVWPIFANQYYSSKQQFSDGVGSLLDASNLLSYKRNQKLLCARSMTGTAQRDSVFLQSPLLPQRCGPTCLGWFLSLFVCGFFTKQKGLFFVFFWFRNFTKSGGLVHCDIFFQYILLNSQSLLGKVSWGNQNLLLSLWNSEIKTTLQNNWVVINVLCRLVTQSIGQ